MSAKRLQVLLEPDEFERVRQDAERHGMTVSDWVRLTLRDRRREEAQGSVEAKLDVIDRALRLEHPTADIDRMLDEIEQGRDDAGVAAS